MFRYVAVVISILAAGCGDKDIPTAGTQSSAIQATVNSKVEQHAVVMLTPAAVAKVLATQAIEQPYLRVSVVTSGTTGFMYDLKFDDHLNPDNDYVNVSDGVTAVVDKRSALFLQGTIIDWQTTTDGRQGFKFDNPNAVK